MKPQAQNKPESGAARKYFISYAHLEAEDRELAAWLREALIEVGHEVFVDTDIPLGAKWGAEIEGRIEWCDFLIVLLSEASAASEMVADEVRRARNRHRTHGRPTILPIRVRYRAIRATN
jgi:TIR domain